MPVVREALRDIERNWRLVALYAGVLTALSLLVSAGNYAFLQDVFGDVPDNMRRLYEFISELVMVFVYAAMQATVFAALGKDIDRPLYKVAGPMDALRRFFTLWVLINLAILALLQGLNMAGEAESPIVHLLFMLFLLAFLFMIPVGACVMFTGRLHWPEFFASLAPLGRHAGLTLVVVFVAFFQFYLFLAFGPETVPTKEPSFTWALAAVPYSALQAIFDCLILAAVWRICMVHRDTEHEDDLDF